LINVHDEDIIDETMDKGKGVILMSAHLSNWELFAYAFPFFYKL